MRTLARRLLPLLAAGAAVGVVMASPSTAASSNGPPTAAAGPLAAADSPIDHVVIIYLENHSFDNILGKYCTNNPLRRCEGATTGKLPDGTSIPLQRLPDLVPETGHTGWEQIAAIHGGKMDGWPSVRGCEKNRDPNNDNTLDYGCYSQITQPTKQIPAMTELVKQYAISDRTFQLDNIPSWHAHLELATATLDGFAEDPGKNPMPSTFTTKTGPGWGCNSFRDVWWGAGANKQLVPSCIPDKEGKGPYRPSPVKYVPTIMDRLDAKGLSWRIYDGDLDQGAYWGICPSLHECYKTTGTQRKNFVQGSAFIPAAKAGTLPALSIVIPRGDQSQHGGVSMIAGDNWVSSLVKGVMVGDDWNSTAIFITYDDCGCFYDHVTPPTGLGVRVPMLIVSPWVKKAYTDHANASIISMLTFTEHNFGLAPLTTADANAYDYRNSFDYTQVPLPPVNLPLTRVPKSSQDWLARHPIDRDDPEWAT